MRRGRGLAVTLFVGLMSVPGCSGKGGTGASSFEKMSLSPGDNPFGPEDPLWAPQPDRDHPYQVVVSADGSKLYVALRGDEDAPGNRVAVIDTASGRALDAIAVGSSPSGMALHPGGVYLAVANRFSNYVSIVDTRSDRVVAEIFVPFYTREIAFAPDGTRAYLTNQWKDSVLRWDLRVDGTFEVVGDNYSATPLDQPAGIAVGQNPRDLAVSADGSRLYVAALTGLSVSIIDTESEREIKRVDLNSPPGDVALVGDYVVVSHTGSGTHHPPDEGFDTNGDGKPGDGTANVLFQDLQNELAVFDRDGRWLHNYTSDTICCADYRDVDPDRPNQGESLTGQDTWPPSRVAFLPPRETWIVACALPEQMTSVGNRLLVVCSGSNEVQGFDVGVDGALTPRQTAGGLYETGMNPYGIAVSPDGATAYVAERLGEYVTALDLAAGPGYEERILAGNVSGGEFPATDAEIGAAFNFVTSGFTVDGDQTCVHCHREGGNLAKPVAMPLQEDTVWGTRMIMAYRGAFDTRPWFIESSMAETNFLPVINEFARKENFCCEQLDRLIWDAYPSLTSCVDDSNQAGCNHVLDCRNDPPPECAARGYGGVESVRNEHFAVAAQRLFGRATTFGDALYQEIIDDDGVVVRSGITVDFNGATRAIGLFLLAKPRLLPNPWASLQLPAAVRGKRIYESAATGCAFCHPLPTTAATASMNPYGVATRFAPVVTPRRQPDTGVDVDPVNRLFLGSFPDTLQDDAGLHIGVPQLRGIWDRANRFLHDGRASNLRECLATPGHPALQPGEIGYNETDGMPDTHGGTSHLSPEQLEDLIAYVLTL